MSGTQDQVTGKAKEAVGDLTDDKDLQREGQADQAAGKTKNKLDEAKDWMSDKIDDARDSLSRG